MTWSPLSGCSVRNFRFIAMSLNMAVFPYSQITWTLPGPCFLLFMSFSLCLCSGPQGSFPLGTRSSVLRNVLPVHWPPPATLPTVALKILRGHGKMYHASAVSLQSAVRGVKTSRGSDSTQACVSEWRSHPSLTQKFHKSPQVFYYPWLLAFDVIFIVNLRPHLLIFLLLFHWIIKKYTK